MIRPTPYVCVVRAIQLALFMAWLRWMLPAEIPLLVWVAGWVAGSVWISILLMRTRLHLSRGRIRLRRGLLWVRYDCIPRKRVLGVRTVFAAPGLREVFLHLPSGTVYLFPMTAAQIRPVFRLLEDAHAQ